MMATFKVKDTGYMYSLTGCNNVQRIISHAHDPPQQILSLGF